MEGISVEDQQFAAIKEWWENKGRALVLLVLIILACYGAYRYYGYHNTVVQERASVQYDLLITAMSETEDPEKIIGQASALSEEFGNTAYGVMSDLILAQHAVKNNQLDEAITRLKRAERHNRGEIFRHIINIRLARVYLAKNDQENAMKLVSIAATDTPFKTWYEELKGDVYRQQGAMDKARDAYRASLEAAERMPRPLVQMKLQDIALKELATPQGAHS